MTYQEYIKNRYKVDNEVANKIVAHIKLYKGVDLISVCDEVDKYETEEDLFHRFTSILSNEWNKHQKARLLGWDLSVYLESIGFTGPDVDKYLFGLIVNHAYMEFLNLETIRELVDKIVDYCMKRKETTYSKLIEYIKKSKAFSKLAIPYATLEKMATIDCKEWDKLVEHIENHKKLEEEK